MIFRQLFDPATSTYTYVIADASSRKAVIIDPVINHVERDLSLLRELSLNLCYCLETHIHADHVTGAGLLREKTGARIGVGEHAGASGADLHLGDGHIVEFGSHRLEVRTTPGHTQGCVTFVLAASDQTLAFTGDALLIRGCGRTDFQGGDAATLYRSVHTKIFTLPAQTLIYPGHDYSGHRCSSVGEEKAHNPRLNDSIDEAQFVEIMGALKLGLPQKIDSAVPANLNCGISPDSSDGDGRSPL